MIDFKKFQILTVIVLIGSICVIVPNSVDRSNRCWRFLANRCNATFGYCHEMSSVCLSSVTRMYCGQTVSWIRMPLGMEVGLCPSDTVLDGDHATLTLTLDTEVLHL